MFLIESSSCSPFPTSPENYGKDLIYKFAHVYEKRVGNGVDRFIDYHGRCIIEEIETKFADSF